MRVVLSIIAKFFDPIGWLGPIIVVAEIIMQPVRRYNIHWDAPLLPVTDIWSRLLRHLSEGMVI